MFFFCIFGCSFTGLVKTISMIDWNLFSTYLGHFEKDQIVDLISEFITTYPENLSKLRTAVAEKDYTGVSQIAHPLKTNCNWFGASDAVELALQLEMMGKKAMEDKMDEVLPKFEAAMDEMIRELTDFKDAQSSE